MIFQGKNSLVAIENRLSGDTIRHSKYANNEVPYLWSVILIEPIICCIFVPQSA